MSEDKNAFSGLYVGARELKSMGGWGYTFFVPYDEADAAHRVLGGVYKPDTPVNVGIVPIAMVGDSE